MRFKFYIITLLLATLLIGGASAHAQKSKDSRTKRDEEIERDAEIERDKQERDKQDKDKGKNGKKQTEITVPALETVNVALSTGNGHITVRGWDRREVHAQTKDPGAKIETRPADGADEAHPASRLEIRVSEKSDDEEDPEPDSDIDVTLNVPRGATVYLTTLDGDVDVEDVAEAHVESAGGRIDLRRISRATEAGSAGGDITLEDAGGRVRLNTLGGIIEVKGLRALDASDFLKVRTVSGDILLEGIGPARVEAGTISGIVKLVGPLARGGDYTFKTTNGDVTLELPADSSFTLNAKVSAGGEIVTDFPLKYKGVVSPGAPIQSGRILGTYGAGDATINLVSFSGTLQLRKK